MQFIVKLTFQETSEEESKLNHKIKVHGNGDG